MGKQTNNTMTTMAISSAVRDGAYLLIVGAQLFGMIAMDLVPFYPKSLWEAPTSPLHPITFIRSTYVSFTGDPFFAHDIHEPWFQAFLYIEALVQLPLAVYLVYKLAGGRATSEAAKELAGLMFGCVTGMGSTTCCYYLSTLGDEMVTPAQKTMLFWGEYLPYAVIPMIMAVDMHQRLLNRIAVAEA